MAYTPPDRPTNASGWNADMADLANVLERTPRGSQYQRGQLAALRKYAARPGEQARVEAIAARWDRADCKAAKARPAEIESEKLARLFGVDR